MIVTETMHQREHLRTTTGVASDKSLDETRVVFGKVQLVVLYELVKHHVGRVFVLPIRARPVYAYYTRSVA